MLTKVHIVKAVCVSRSVVSDSLQPHGTVAHQAPLSMEFSMQEYWSGLPSPSAEDLPDSGIEPRSPLQILYRLSPEGNHNYNSSIKVEVYLWAGPSLFFSKSIEQKSQRVFSTETDFFQQELLKHI